MNDSQTVPAIHEATEKIRRCSFDLETIEKWFSHSGVKLVPPMSYDVMQWLMARVRKLEALLDVAENQLAELENTPRALSPDMAEVLRDVIAIKQLHDGVVWATYVEDKEGLKQIKGELHRELNRTADKARKFLGKV